MVDLVDNGKWDFKRKVEVNAWDLYVTAGWALEALDLSDPSESVPCGLLHLRRLIDAIHPNIAEKWGIDQIPTEGCNDGQNDGENSSAVESTTQNISF